MIDGNTVRRIVGIAGVGTDSSVVEIGPGLGSLTLGLTETGASVVAVEIDRRLADQLPITVQLMQPDARLTVITADAMTIAELPGEPTTLVANLPYNVSVPVLLHMLEQFPAITSGLVMVQSEVGQRLAAAPGSKIYGSPSVKAAWYGRFATAGTVSRQVFWPVPNVDSILVSFSAAREPLGEGASGWQPSRWWMPHSGSAEDAAAVPGGDPRRQRRHPRSFPHPASTRPSAESSSRCTTLCASRGRRARAA